MRKQKCRTFLIIVITLLICGCVSLRKSSIEKTKIISLNFTKCLPEEKTYKYIEIEALKGYRLKKIINEGFCEYQLKYKDSLIFYVSSDIYSGSRINFKNTYAIGIDTYAKSRSLEPVDTIKNEGQQENGKYWLEYILGDVVVGYVNMPLSHEIKFKHMINTLKRVPAVE